VQRGDVMSLTQRFFAEGEIQEARAWKNSPLLFDETTEPEATKYTSFDRVPRRWTPIVIATLVVAMAGAGGAWALGLWQPPPEVVTWARRFDPRIIFTPTAPSAAALVGSTPAVQPAADAPRVEAAAPAPRVEAAAPAPRVEAAAPAPGVEAAAPAPVALVALPGPSAPAERSVDRSAERSAEGSSEHAPAVTVSPAAAAVAATSDVPVARAQVPAAAQPAEAIAPPTAVVIPIRARSAASVPDGSRAMASAPQRPRGAHLERAATESKARHGYVWSDTRGNLVPARPAPAAATSAAPDDTLPLSTTEQGSSSTRRAAAWDSESTDTEQPAPTTSPRRSPPTSSTSASEPPPIPVPAIEPAKKLSEPTEMAAPSAR